MKYFSPNYWFKIWLLSAPLFNDQTKGINAKSINNNEKIKNWSSKNISILNTFNENINYENLKDQSNQIFLQTQEWFNNLNNEPKQENEWILTSQKLRQKREIEKNKREAVLLWNFGRNKATTTTDVPPSSIKQSIFSEDINKIDKNKYDLVNEEVSKILLNERINNSPIICDSIMKKIFDGKSLIEFVIDIIKEREFLLVSELKKQLENEIYKVNKNNKYFLNENARDFIEEKINFIFPIFLLSYNDYKNIMINSNDWVYIDVACRFFLSNNIDLSNLSIETIYQTGIQLTLQINNSDEEINKELLSIFKTPAIIYYYSNHLNLISDVSLEKVYKEFFNQIIKKDKNKSDFLEAANNFTNAMKEYKPRKEIVKDILEENNFEVSNENINEYIYASNHGRSCWVLNKLNLFGPRREIEWKIYDLARSKPYINEQYKEIVENAASAYKSLNEKKIQLFFDSYQDKEEINFIKNSEIKRVYIHFINKRIPGYGELPPGLFNLPLNPDAIKFMNNKFINFIAKNNNKTRKYLLILDEKLIYFLKKIDNDNMEIYKQFLNHEELKKIELNNYNYFFVNSNKIQSLDIFIKDISEENKEIFKNMLWDNGYHEITSEWSVNFLLGFIPFYNFIKAIKEGKYKEAAFDLVFDILTIFPIIGLSGKIAKTGFTALSNSLLKAVSEKTITGFLKIGGKELAINFEKISFKSLSGQIIKATTRSLDPGFELVYSLSKFGSIKTFRFIKNNIEKLKHEKGYEKLIEEIELILKKFEEPVNRIDFNIIEKFLTINDKEISVVKLYNLDNNKFDYLGIDVENKLLLGNKFDINTKNNKLVNEIPYEIFNEPKTLQQLQKDFDNINIKNDKFKEYCTRFKRNDNTDLKNCFLNLPVEVKGKIFAINLNSENFSLTQAINYNKILNNNINYNLNNLLNDYAHSDFKNYYIKRLFIEISKLTNNELKQYLSWIYKSKNNTKKITLENIIETKKELISLNSDNNIFHHMSVHNDIQEMQNIRDCFNFITTKNIKDTRNNPITLINDFNEQLKKSLVQKNINNKTPFELFIENNQFTISDEINLNKNYEISFNDLINLLITNDKTFFSNQKQNLLYFQKVIDKDNFFVINWLSHNGIIPKETKMLNEFRMLQLNYNIQKLSSITGDSNQDWNIWRKTYNEIANNIKKDDNNILINMNSVDKNGNNVLHYTTIKRTWSMEYRNLLSFWYPSQEADLFHAENIDNIVNESWERTKDKMTTIFNNHPEILDNLLKKTNNAGETPLVQGINNGIALHNLKMLSLRRNGIIIDNDELYNVFKAIMKNIGKEVIKNFENSRDVGLLSRINEVIDTSTGDTSLHKAIKEHDDFNNDNTELVSWLKSRNASKTKVNNVGETAIKLSENKPKILEILNRELLVVIPRRRTNLVQSAISTHNQKNNKNNWSLFIGVKNETNSWEELKATNINNILYSGLGMNKLYGEKNNNFYIFKNESSYDEIINTNGNNHLIFDGFINNLEIKRKRNNLIFFDFKTKKEIIIRDYYSFYLSYDSNFTVHNDKCSDFFLDKKNKIINQLTEDITASFKENNDTIILELNKLNENSRQKREIKNKNNWNNNLTKYINNEEYLPNLENLKKYKDFTNGIV